MRCKYPLAGVRSGISAVSGKRAVRVLGQLLRVCKENPGKRFLPLPCGQCILCRLERSRMWATRLMHEKKFQEYSCFLTLTYDEKHVTENKSLVSNEISAFIKRFRSVLHREGRKDKIKYFGVGEYGCDDPESCRTPGCSHSARPHYHLAMFGFEDSERTDAPAARSGSPQYEHALIDRAWRKGFARFSQLSFESAAYVARYCLKKINGEFAEEHYDGRVPEFVRCSKGIAKAYFDCWRHDVYPADEVLVEREGALVPCTPPRIYDRWLDKEDPVMFEKVKKARERSILLVDDLDYEGLVRRNMATGEVAELKQKAFSPRS